MKQVMVRAWEIAREGQAKFGGKVSEYFAKSLKLAWAEVKTKKVVAVMNFDTKEMNLYAYRNGRVFMKREGLDRESSGEALIHFQYGLAIADWEIYEIRNGVKSFKENRTMNTERKAA